ncbi:MAG: DUF1987 domain-containing protein [Bacteroidales bacterium]|jgi:hypothetical protein|nr:DUF1987 domain-containing protein [Bacteroidales bacterium]
MKVLIIEETADTPYINLNPNTGIFEFRGNSIPENVSSFYEPILDWLDRYIECPNENTKFNFKLKMISSASSKIFFDILIKIDMIHELENSNVKVSWFYNIFDDEIKDIGLDYKDSMNVPFELISN